MKAYLKCQGTVAGKVKPLESAVSIVVNAATGATGRAFCPSAKLCHYCMRRFFIPLQELEKTTQLNPLISTVNYEIRLKG